MAAELGLLSLTQLQKLAQQHHHQLQQQQPQPQSHPTTSSSSSLSAATAGVSWMWNPNQLPHVEDDDSWEIRAFEQDTGNINGTTWPPRSYTCSFCRREFRSAQALGGHMNVHRRDRARLHQSHHVLNNSIPNSSSSNFPSPTILIPAPEFVTTNGGLCLIYSLANPNGVITPTTTVKSCMDSPSSSSNPNLISPYPPQSYTNHTPNHRRLSSQICHSTNPQPSELDNSSNEDCENKKDSGEAIEELDLELRLWPR